MLRFRPTGTIEALPQQEARVRSLTDFALRREVAASEPDPFAIAEAIGRALLVFTPERGWHLASTGQSLTAAQARLRAL